MEDETSFEQGRALLASAYRRLPVVLLQADLPLNERCLYTTHTNDLAWVSQQHAVVVSLLFLMTDTAHGAQPFEQLVPLLPASLASGELRRVYWHEQPIALSLHPDPLPPHLLSTQLLGAILAWSSERKHPYPHLIVSDEAREHMSMRDPLPLSALRTSVQPSTSSTDPAKGDFHS